MVNDIARSTATGVPILGGLLNRMDAATNAALAPLLNPLFEPKDQLTESNFGERYAHALADQQRADQRFATEHPALDTAAKLAGGVASMAPVVRAVPWAFGVGNALPTMVVRSGLTSAGIGGADAAARGQDIPRGATVGGILGAVLPVAGRTVGTWLSPSTSTPAADAVVGAAEPAVAKELPVLYFDRAVMPNIAAHIEKAIAEGKPDVLTRMIDNEAKRANRSAALVGMGRLPKTHSWDEYPFASVREGGKGASTAKVPRSEQNTQGWTMSKFYSQNNIGQDDQFRVRISPPPPDKP